MPQSHRLRAGRRSIDSQIYLLTTVTLRREPLFTSLSLGRCVVQSLMAAARSSNTLAYVVMPDHLHWLAQLKDGYSLPEVMRYVKGDSSRRVNRLRGFRAPVWCKGFHDHALRREESIRHCARYIVANPLRAGIVENIGDYALWDAIWLDPMM